MISIKSATTCSIQFLISYTQSLQEVLPTNWRRILEKNTASHQETSDNEEVWNRGTLVCHFFTLGFVHVICLLCSHVFSITLLPSDSLTSIQNDSDCLKPTRFQKRGQVRSCPGGRVVCASASVPHPIMNYLVRGKGIRRVSCES